MHKFADFGKGMVINMGSLYIGTKKIEQQEIDAFIGMIDELLEKANLQAGGILICAAQHQYGTYIQWNVCKKRGLIPFLIAPDYDIQNSKFMEYTDAEYVLRIDMQMQVTLERLEKGKGKHLELKDAAVIHMTSATTGNPKFIIRTKQNLDLEMTRYCKAAGITSEDRMMSIAPYFHAYAFVGPLLACEYTGADLILPDIIMPRNMITLCKDMRITYLYGVPYFFKKMIDVDEQYQLGEQMKVVVSSGEKLEEPVWNAFKKRFGVELTQQYGSTETGTITICKLGDPPECQGLPIEGNDICFKEENGKNIMIVDTHGTMGYYVTDELKPIAEGYYETNDVGYFDEQGRLFIDGRKDDIIIRAGEKINLKLIGKIISQYEGIERAEVKLDISSDLKELICYYDAEDANDGLEEELLLYCKQHLSVYQIPRKFIRSKIEKKNNWKQQES